MSAFHSVHIEAHGSASIAAAAAAMTEGCCSTAAARACHERPSNSTACRQERGGCDTQGEL
jgi:hypothetical protein